MNSLSEMLDAIEVGLLHLRRERDELRETLARTSPARTSPHTEVKTTKPATAKAPSKGRPALGRTLSQIRKP